MATEFTASQLEAIEYRRSDACVVAGPGSGKTTVLVERYRRLIEEHRFEPREILAITFTEKAAANMKAKVAEQFRHDADRLRDLESAWISTIHGFCARLLRDNAIASGIDPRFAVLDARESDDLRFECMNAALDELVENDRDAALALIDALKTPRITADLIDTCDAIRSAGKTITEVRAMKSPGAQITRAVVAGTMVSILQSWPPRAQLSEARRKHFDLLAEWARNFADGSDERCPLRLGSVPETSKPELEEFRETLMPAYAATVVDERTAPFRQMIFDVLLRFDHVYNVRKSARAALDFNDLERRTIDLLRSSKQVQVAVREQFRQVMLDEFQDINEQQAELIRLVRADDVFFAVGDINQSIYGFRHARPQIFRDYRNEVGAAGKQSCELMHNFRSRAEILRGVESLLNSADGIEAHTLEAAKAFEPKGSPSIEVLSVLEDDAGEGIREARWIAYRILSMRGGEFDFRDFAVLCRSHDAMKPFLEEFDRAGIPYVCGRRQSFLVSREGLDITAALQTVANPRNSIALGTVLRSGLVGISDESLLRLRMLANSVGAGLNMVAYDPSKFAEFDERDVDKLERFIANLKRWRADQPVIPLDVLIVRVLSDCGFEWVPGSARGDNVEAFLRLARGSAGDRTLLEFLRELESIEGAMSAESDLSDEDQGNAVQVMTAHAAKGLEFAVTIVAAMHKGTQRSGATVTFTPEHGIGLRWKGGDKDGLKDSWALANSTRLTQREKEEENRLLYVAMTRAEQHLILSYSHDGKRKPAHWAKRVAEFFGPQVQFIDADPLQLSVSAVERLQAADVPALRRPVHGDQHDSAVNVTSLTVFAQCSRKYYIQRRVGWNSSRSRAFDPEDMQAQDDDGDLPAAELGSMVHELLAGKAGDYQDEVHALARVFTESDLGRRALSATRLAREWDFIVDIGGTLVTGSIDLWFEENGQIHLLDYKTDVQAKPADYAPQLALYALALEKGLGQRPSRAYLHFLRTNRVEEIQIDGPALQRAGDLVRELGEAQDSGWFELKEGDHCKSCQFYRGLCPAGLSIAPAQIVPADLGQFAEGL